MTKILCYIFSIILIILNFFLIFMNLRIITSSMQRIYIRPKPAQHIQFWKMTVPFNTCKHMSTLNFTISMIKSSRGDYLYKHHPTYWVHNQIFTLHFEGFRYHLSTLGKPFEDWATWFKSLCRVARLGLPFLSVFSQPILSHLFWAVFKLFYFIHLQVIFPYLHKLFINTYLIHFSHSGARIDWFLYY